MHLRELNENSLSLIKKFEGFRDKVYICPAGHKTIGYGHLIRFNEKLEQIDEIQASNLLEEDLNTSKLAVFRNIKIELNDNEFGALVSFCFNLGAGILQRSTLRQKVNNNEHDMAALEFLKYIYANGIILKGLKIRRHMESLLYKTI